MQVLDADVLIDIQRGFPAAVAWVDSLVESPSVSGLVVMELINEAQNRRQVTVAQHLVAPFPIVWPTSDDCNRALLTFTDFHLSHGLGLMDSLVAATAVGLSATLLTFNLKHFRIVPNLVTRQPYSR